jgi:hypothetical protein
VNISISNVKDDSDDGRWCSYDLDTEGNTLDELLDNASYYMTDQDGGEIGFTEADDALAYELIVEHYCRDHRRLGKLLRRHR